MEPNGSSSREEDWIIERLQAQELLLADLICSVLKQEFLTAV